MSKRMNPEDRKKIILDISKELFSKKGFYETQISDIIEKAGISRGTIYLYFKNKDDLYITLLENFYTSWEKEMKEGIESENFESLSPKKFFFLRIMKSLSFFAKDHHMSNIVLRNTIGIRGEFESIVKRFEKKIRTFIAQDLKFGIDNGFVKKDIDIDLTSEVMGGAILRIAYIYFIKSRPKNNSVMLEELSRKITDIFVSGIFYK